MDRQRPAIDVDGWRIGVGTSIYHTREHRVLWVDEISDSKVRLSSIDSTAEVGRSSFRDKVRDGTLVVESSSDHDEATD